MKKITALLCLTALAAAFFAGCKTSDDSSEEDSLTGVSISASSSVKAGKELTLTASPVKTGSPDITYTWALTDTDSTGSTLSATTDPSVTLTAGTAGSVSVTLTATWGSVTVSDTKKITVTEATTIQASDTPTGYAASGSYYSGSNTITINASDSDAASTLQTYAKKGNYVIYINGMIDMTYNSTYGGSMLPSAWNDDNSALGNFIAANKGNYSGTAITSWSAWRQTYAAFCTQTGDNSEYDSSSAKSATDLNGYQYALVSAWKSQIQIPLASNTTIIGLTDESGIKGGTISISDVSNIVLRNLHLQDAFDPFPHHETSGSSNIKTDGWNAEYDCITVQNETSNIWIDHCTFEDTISVGWTNFAGVKTGYDVAAQAYSTSNSDYEMWQTYDGLCDIKGKASNVTVSYCLFRNHDKTMLLGSDDTEKYNSVELDDTAKTITLHHNFFDGCVQRLPFVRTAHIHIFNNYFKHDGTNGYDQKASVQIRAKAWVISEYNNFGSGITYRYKGDSATQTKGYTSNTKLYDANNTGVSSEKDTYWTSVTEKPFDIEYSYSDYLDTVTDLPELLEEEAGAGTCVVTTES